MAKTVEFVGIGNPRQLDSTNSLSIDFPDSAQPGDLLVLQFERGAGNTAIPSIPSDWTIQSIGNIDASNYYYCLATKMMEPGESRVTITLSVAGSLNGVVSAYRNVKSVAGARGRYFSGTSYSPLSSTFSVAQTDTLALIIATVRLGSGGLTFTPPNGFSQLAEAVSRLNIYHISGKQMGSETSLTPAQTVTTLSREAAGYSALLMVEPFKNTDPTITLSSPADNQTLVEGNTYTIAGTATDADDGNVVTVKYKIDDGTPRNITAAVSDGTTPINFSKTLTYLNNRLYDGQNPVTPILDDQVSHTLTVWAEDDQGGKSPDTTRNFTVLYNQPPEISGSDQDLGTITSPPSIQYSVTDVEGYSFTITEAVDGDTIRSFPGVDGQQETLTIPLEMWITLEPGVTHQLTISATDQYNATSVRTYTFIRAVEGIELETTEILPADAQPSRVILSLNGTIPANANLNVQVCNNAHDPSPTWEDMTDSVKNGRPYVFTNTTSTTGQWGIRFKISILPGA